MARSMRAGEVARALGVRPVTVRRWAADGRIPSDRTAGGHRRFSLDEVTACIAPTPGSARSVAELLRSTIDTWQVQPLHASVFGSVARGEARRGSDLDLLVVRPKLGSGAARRTFGGQMVDLHFTVDHALHRDLREVELDLPHLLQAARSASSLLVDVLREGVLVAGVPLQQLLEPIISEGAGPATGPRAA